MTRWGSQGALDQYLEEISEIPLLTPEKEKELGYRVQSGDEEAAQELAKHNLRFVVSVAKKYQKRGVAMQDLIGVGNKGLLRAAYKFDPDQEVKFISYAVWWVRQAIFQELAEQSRAVRLPLNRANEYARIFRKHQTHLREFENEARALIETANELDLDTDYVLRVLNSNNVLYLDKEVGGEDTRRFDETVDLSDQLSPLEQLEQGSQREYIDRVLDVACTPREKNILYGYFGFDTGEQKTLEEIGDALGITRERVRQLRNRAVEKVRPYFTGERHVDFEQYFVSPKSRTRRAAAANNR